MVVLLGTGGLVGLWPMPKLSSEGAAAVAFLTLLVAWTGLSILWSFAPDLSWGYLNRGITYLTLLAVGIFLGALVRRAPTVLAALIALAVAAALVWALAGKIDPSLFEDGARRARLRDPVGIWNLLAGLLAFGVPLTVWLAGRRFPVLVRALAVGFLFLLVPALALTLSRSGILARSWPACSGSRSLGIASTRSLRSRSPYLQGSGSPAGPSIGPALSTRVSRSLSERPTGASSASTSRLGSRPL